MKITKYCGCEGAFRNYRKLNPIGAFTDYQKMKGLTVYPTRMSLFDSRCSFCGKKSVTYGEFNKQQEKKNISK